MAEITYEVLERFGVLSESPRGWKKELRLINWNNRGARYDLREWSPDDKKASRGLTLSIKEVKELRELLAGLTIPEEEEEAQGQEEVNEGKSRKAS